jgi:hypothetical protein
MKKKLNLFFYCFLIELSLFIINYILISKLFLISTYFYLLFILPSNIIINFNNSFSLNVPAKFTYTYTIILFLLLLINSQKWYIVIKIYVKGKRVLANSIIVVFILILIWISHINNWGS